MSGIEMWDERFAAEDYVFGKAPCAFLLKQKHRLSPGMKILAVADGEGRNGVWLAEQGLDVLAMDGSKVALEKAKRLAEERKVSLKTECADWKEWRWPHEAFDEVVAIFIQFTGPQDRAEMFERMKKALKPGGILLLHGYRPEQLAYGTGGPKAVENLYTEPMLRDAFVDMQILELEAYDAHIEEGAGHRGMSALIDLVARKS